MYFIKEEYTYTYEEKKSKFIAFLSSYSNFYSLMQRLKKEHPKGRHFVYAYRYLNEFDQIVENSSDDGEPKGTSGKPALNVLAGNELINCAVIIVRYFGGIKLGTGGLVRAYGEAVNLAIKEAKLQLYEKLDSLSLELDYSFLSKIEYLINDLEIKISSKEFEENVKLNLSITNEQKNSLLKQLPRQIKVK